MSTANLKAVYTTVERGEGRTHHLRIGTAEVKADGSLAVRLDAVPVSGQLVIRDIDDKSKGGAA